MQIVDRQYLDTERWNDLVDRTVESSIFSYSWYLDEVAENWMVLVDEEYSCGVALPYTVRLGQKTLYTPIFVTYLEWLGATKSSAKVEQLIRNEFPSFDVTFRQQLLGKLPNETYVCQECAVGESRLGSQAKRMLKKADSNRLSVRKMTNFLDVFAVVRTELEGKFTGITHATLDRLEKAFESATESDRLVIYQVEKDGVCQGGIICLIQNHRLTYLKGAVNSEARNLGGMFIAIQRALEDAHAKNQVFDFGGSRVPGVRKFNQHFGGKDVEFFAYQHESRPIWFKWMKRIKNTLFKS